MNIDKLWRRNLVRSAQIFKSAEILDICTGTADIPLAFAGRPWIKKITGLDFSREMLKIGRKKIAKKNHSTAISLMYGDALNLPFSENTFHVVTCGFGFRNLRDREKGLAEINRVLKKEGQVLILELSSSQKGIIKLLYNIYLKKIIPVLGWLLTGSFSAYKYFASSVSTFPHPEEVIKMFKNAGFNNTHCKKIMGGIVYLYVGYKN